MGNDYEFLNVSRAKLLDILEKYEWGCNAKVRTSIYYDEGVRALITRPVIWSTAMFKYAEEIGGLKPGEEFTYKGNTVRVVDLYDVPADLVNAYIYCFGGVMHAPIYVIELLREFFNKNGFIYPFISSGKEGNKGLFIEIFDREEGLIHGNEYGSYYRIMAELADPNWVYENYIDGCSDTDTQGNLVELYTFAKNKGLKEVTYVMVTGNPYYDARLAAEWLLQLSKPEFSEVKINLVIAHSPIWYSYNKCYIPEVKAGSEIAMGYIAASIGPLMKDTITFDGKAESERPERLLMPRADKADWEVVKRPIVHHSNMGWPNYMELLYGIDHKEAVENIILSDIFARASFSAEDYDRGIWAMIDDYKMFLGGGFDPKKETFESYLKGTTEKKFF